MKKIANYFQLAALVAALAVFFSCQNQLVPLPRKVSTANNNVNAVTKFENVTASHGGKRVINLAWNTITGADRYYIFRASSPMGTFERCGETRETQFALTVPPGITRYFRIQAVQANGTVSCESLFVMGTSLAQPLITDIIENESSATVTWYMDNVSPQTYQNELRYIVYCFDGETEIGKEVAEGTDTKVTFNDLLANTNYTFQVEAYLNSDQINSELSEKTDKATARRMRPGAPVNFRVARGESVNAITLFFDLPEMVEETVQAEAGMSPYVQRPLYFTVKKRVYNTDKPNQYELVCAYFGTTARNADAVVFAETYTPGASVSWTDTEVVRGMDYEYEVQAYADGSARVISSESSKASAAGWLLNKGRFAHGKAAFTANEDKTFFVSAGLPVVFTFNPHDEDYDYVITTKVQPIGDGDPNEPAGTFELESAILNYEQAKAFRLAINLTQKSSASSPGRGIYLCSIHIRLPGETEAVETLVALGDVIISEDIDPPVVEDFEVLDGYTDKFIVNWTFYPNRRYELFISEDRETWTRIAIFNPAPEYGDNVYSRPESYVVTDGKRSFEDTGGDVELEVGGIGVGVTRYFAMLPIKYIDGAQKHGQRAYADDCQTLGKPELSPITSRSYSAFTLVWAEAQRANDYTVSYRYTGASQWLNTGRINKDDLDRDGSGKFTYTFLPENDSIDAANAGKEIQVVVNAWNNDFYCESNNVSARLVGPAELGLAASMAASASYIDVEWNSIPGADGYYIYRREFNINNTAEESDEPIVYYVNTTNPDHITITGKNMVRNSNTISDAADVKATIVFENEKYILHDEYMADSEYHDSVYEHHIELYRNQQNNIVRGNPFRYYVIPIINRDGHPESLNNIKFEYATNSANKNTNIAKYTMSEGNKTVTFVENKLEKTGFTYGFVQNVNATKGSYSSAPSGNYPVNDGIKITWTAPPLLANIQGFAPQYTVYRKAYNETVWIPVKEVPPEGPFECFSDDARGKMFEYLVGISNQLEPESVISQPQDSERFLQWCRAQMEEESKRPKMQGYMLDMVKVRSVSRNEQKVGDEFAEEVQWYSGGVENGGPNRNWGIDGYTVFVMNRNIDGDWHEIANISGTNMSNETNQSVKVTNNTGLLKVMRDYKHYFKVRTYVLNGGEKVYSPDPDWNYEILFRDNNNFRNQDNANFLQTDYVKWGARQITTTEFARIASLHIAWGIHATGGYAPINWQSTLAAYWRDTNGNNGSSGRVGCQSSAGVGKWWFYFDRYKPDLDTNANRNNWNYSTIFLTIDADRGDRYSSKMIYGDSYGAGTFPDWYGRDGSDVYGSQYIDITGPSCVAPLYSGGLRYNGSSSNNALKWDGGTIQVKYPTNAAEVQISGGGQVNTPLPFSNQAGHSATGDHRRTILDAWY